MVTVRLTPSGETRFSHDAEALPANRHYIPRDSSDPNRGPWTSSQPRYHRLGCHILHSSYSWNLDRHRRDRYRWSLSLLQSHMAGDRGRLSPWKGLGVDPRNDLHGALHPWRSLRRVYRIVPSRLCVSLLDYHDHLSHQISRQSLLRQRNGPNLHARHEHSTNTKIRSHPPITDSVRSGGTANLPVQPFSPSIGASAAGGGDCNGEMSFLRSPARPRQLVLH